MTTPITPSLPVAPLPQNRFGTDPTLKDLLDLHKKDINLFMNVHHVGTVTGFDKDNQTGSATVNYQKTRFVLDPTSGTYVPQAFPYPQLVDCPVIVLGGGPCSLTFPIAEGDECLILFNDRDLDNWFEGSTSATVATPRLHSFSDGIILVGIRSLANSLDNYDMARAVLQNGTTMVGVGADKIKVANATKNLNAILQNLISTLSSLTTIPAVVGSPLTLALPVIMNLNTIATDLGGLLE